MSGLAWYIQVMRHFVNMNAKANIKYLFCCKQADVSGN